MQRAHITPLYHINASRQGVRISSGDAKKYSSYHQHLLAFPVFVVPVGRLSADAFELLLDDGFQHGIYRTWTPCEDSEGKSDSLPEAKQQSVSNLLIIKTTEAINLNYLFTV